MEAIFCDESASRLWIWDQFSVGKPCDVIKQTWYFTLVVELFTNGKFLEFKSLLQTFLTQANMYLCIVPRSEFFQLSYSQHIYVRWEFHTFYTRRKVFLQRFCHCTCGFRVMKKNESGICIIWTTHSKPQLLNILAANSLCFTCV